MRILQLRFKNLNSLLGEWQIDLTDPAYGNDGIFAITGPTGAGKSTILDAICLALYGRTPRLSKITKSSNEIMSRHSGECFAEITFETPAGQFRCHWSQHRARKKAAGDLQAPKHEIADALSGRIIEAKIRDVAQRIESITGMDFERFTLSMLLAQGGFAAFLQAPPDQRAPILEQITGSDIYSQISIRVHELRVIENNKLNTLKAELAGITLLSPEDETQLKTRLEQQRQLETELNAQREQYSQAMRWLDTIAYLQKELQELDQQSQNLLKRRTDFKASEKKLDDGKRALQLAGDYANLCALRQAQSSERAREQQWRLDLPAKKQALSLAEDKLNKCKQALSASRDAQSLALPIIRETQTLDLKYREQQVPIFKAAATRNELEKNLIHLHKQLQKSRLALAKNEADLACLETQLSASQADENLVDQLSGLQSRFASLRTIRARYQEKSKQCDNVKTEYHSALRQWQEQLMALKKQDTVRQELEDHLASKQKERLQTLAGEDLNHWHTLHENLSQRKNTLEKLRLYLKTLTQSQGLQSELKSRQALLTENINKGSKQLSTQTEKQAALERELHLLETQLLLLNKIHSLEQAREQLKNGEPCPLCGASEHPYAAGNAPQANSDNTQLKDVKTELNQVSQSLTTHKVSIAKDSQELEQVNQQLRETAQLISEQQALFEQTKQQLGDRGLAVDDEKLSDFLPQLEKNNQKLLNEIAQRVATINQQDQALLAIKASLDSANSAAHQLQQNLLTASHHKDSAEQTCKRLYKELDTLAGLVQQEQQDTLAAVSIYGISSLPEDDFCAVEEALAARREQWLAKQLEKSRLDQDIAKLTLQAQHQNQQISEKNKELQIQQTEHAALLDAQRALQCERKTLFGDKDPVLEESRLAEAIISCEKALAEANQDFQNTSEESAKLKSQIKAIGDSLQSRAERLKNTENSFNQRLAEHSFASEEDYKTACISNELRDKLSRKVEELKAEQSGLDARRKDKFGRLAIEREKQMTQRSFEELQQELDNTVNNLKLVQQELGACQQKLDDNKILKASQQERATAIDAQKIECQRWDNLHLLIGSADGKKYRNFAQGLTFELLVGHANRQLQKMSDRYLLIRDKTEPLELNVVDNYQAGEIRSTKNLSGGESFIVSLSLALGLSRMASKNIRVDSLFLDEGFGTLDEEALDTALEALSGLQQSGKLIGVISHVSSLKERIATQIQVSPQTGGRSLIHGPGCQRLN